MRKKFRGKNLKLKSREGKLTVLSEHGKPLFSAECLTDIETFWGVYNSVKRPENA